VPVWPRPRARRRCASVAATAALLLAACSAAPQWARSSDPDYDVGFVALEPHDGQNIQQVLGASRLATDLGDRYLVHVTGYPDSENVPISCVNWTSRFSDTQLKFECAGYTGGTSGSPWVTRLRSRPRPRPPSPGRPAPPLDGRQSRGP
jgi:hypothetical protein